MSIDSWRQQFEDPDDDRMVRLGERVEAVVAAGDSAALRAALRDALLARLDAAPPSPERAGAWAASEEERADERAWAAEDAGDDAEYVRHFQDARGLGAVREIAEDVEDGDAVAGAVYELFHALGSTPEAVFEVLSQAPDPWPELARGAGR
jgi:hypothetical protein